MKWEMDELSDKATKCEWLIIKGAFKLIKVERLADCRVILIIFQGNQRVYKLSEKDIMQHR